MNTGYAVMNASGQRVAVFRDEADAKDFVTDVSWRRDDGPLRVAPMIDGMTIEFTLPAVASAVMAA